MSSKFFSFPTSSGADVCAEKVLKRIKEAICRSDHKYRYDATKTSTRNSREFRTFVPDQEDAWKVHFKRKKETLTKGFLSDKNKPYKAIGKVCLSSEEVLLNSVTDELKALLANQTSFADDNVTAELGSPNVSTLCTTAMKPLSTAGKKRNFVRNSSGLQPIKDRLAELKEMKRHMKAHTNLRRLLRKGKSTPSATEMITIDYLQTINRQSETDSSTERKDLNTESSSIEASRNFVQKTIASDSSAKNPPRLKKSLLPELTMILSERQIQAKLTYLVEKLEALNRLFCAIFNMKTKQVKHLLPLSGLQIVRLLQSQVILDDDGRPAAWKVPAPTTLGEEELRTYSTYTSHDFLENPVSERSSYGFYADGRKSVVKRQNSHLCGPGIMQRNFDFRQKLNQRIFRKLYNRRTDSIPGIMTWEDLIADKPGKRSYSEALRKRDVVYQVAVDVAAPWLGLEQAEKVIRVRKAVNFIEDPPKKTAESGLQKVRDEFHEMQKRLESEMSLECSNHKRHQTRQMRLKLEAFTLQPFVETNLRRMRTAARMSSNRDAKMLKPLQWFTNLELEAKMESDGLMGEEIHKLIRDIARFKFENVRTMPLAKEKLCLLVMSMPAHLLLPESMTDAVVFLLERVLESPAELFHCWLMKRKLDKISNIRKYSLIRR